MAEAPYLITKVPWRIIKSSTAQRLVVENGEYERVIEADRREQERLFENFRLYWGVNYGQWDEHIAQQLLDENRNPLTINILSQKINTLAGAITETQFFVDFMPYDGMRSSLTKAFKDIYLSDKQYQRWDNSWHRAAKYGLVYRGDEQMYIDRRKNPDGNIAWRCLPPGRARYDLNWQTDSSIDCRKGWVLHYMGIQDIADTFGIALEELKHELEIVRQAGNMYSQVRFDLGRQAGYKQNGMHRVIEVHEMHTVKTTRLVDPTKGYAGLPFPVANPKKDADYLKQWGDANQVNWEYVQERPYEDKILKIMTFSPDLSMTRVLEDRPSEIQIKRLDLFPWAADRCNGKWRGVVDLCKDIQQNLNKHQSQKIHMINSAANGMRIINSELFGGDSNKLEEIKRNINNPSFITDAPIDDVEKTHVTLKDQPYDAALFQNETLMIELFDLVTPVPAAMSSRTESSRESGVLYQSKVAIAEVGMKTLNESLRQHTVDKASAYYEQAQLLYRKKHRKFPRADQQGYVDVNMFTTLNGRPVIINDISVLPRCYVLIKEDPNGLMKRHQNREQYMHIMKSVPDDLPLMRAFCAIRTVQTMDMDDQDRLAFDAIGKMEFQRMMFRFRAEIMQSEVMTKQGQLVVAQVEMQLQQLMQQAGALPQEGMEPMQYTEVQGEGGAPALPAPEEAPEQGSNVIPFAVNQ